MINDKDHVASRFPVGTFVARPCVGIPSGKDDTLKQTREKFVRALFGTFDTIYKERKTRDWNLKNAREIFFTIYQCVCDVKTGRGYVKKNRR